MGLFWEAVNCRESGGCSRGATDRATCPTCHSVVFPCTFAEVNKWDSEAFVSRALTRDSRILTVSRGSLRESQNFTEFFLLTWRLHDVNAYSLPKHVSIDRFPYGNAYFILDTRKKTRWVKFKKVTYFYVCVCEWYF